jgi:mannose-6-phosphate isomerase-like protein (cupin superfamily)
MRSWPSRLRTRLALASSRVWRGLIEGVLRIDFRDGAVQVSAGEMFIVPKGVEHKPYAEHEVKLLLIEPRGILNTGHEGGERTAQNNVWI